METSPSHTPGKVNLLVGKGRVESSYLATDFEVITYQNILCAMA
jgi:hypothetical protein